jgi:hypothetical protein
LLKIRAGDLYAKVAIPLSGRSASFPFSIRYILFRQRILILAIAHSRRLPGYWQGRIKAQPSGTLIERFKRLLESTLPIGKIKNPLWTTFGPLDRT